MSEKKKTTQTKQRNDFRKRLIRINLHNTRYHHQHFKLSTGYTLCNLCKQDYDLKSLAKLTQKEKLSKSSTRTTARYLGPTRPFSSQPTDEFLSSQELLGTQSDVSFQFLIKRKNSF